MNIVQSWQQNSGFRSNTLRIYLIFQSFLWIFKFKVILSCFQSRLKTLAYSEPCQYTLRKSSILRFLIHLISFNILIYLILNKPQHIQNTVNLQNTIYTEFTTLLNLSIFRTPWISRIQFTQNSQLFITLPFKDLDIFKTLSSIYNGAFCSEPCVTLAYLEPCHNQNLRNIRDPVKHLWCSIF